MESALRRAPTSLLRFGLEAFLYFLFASPIPNFCFTNMSQSWHAQREYWEPGLAAVLLSPVGTNPALGSSSSGRLSWV